MYGIASHVREMIIHTEIKDFSFSCENSTQYSTRQRVPDHCRLGGVAAMA
jgi:hypothetical protein